jgi:uncharacterized membrane protein (DUF373 family)
MMSAPSILQREAVQRHDLLNTPRGGRGRPLALGGLACEHLAVSEGTGRGLRQGTNEPLRTWSTAALRQVEYVANVSIAVALAAGGAALFVHVVYRFFAQLDDRSFVDQILNLLDGLLLVFILSELLHTVRATVEENVLMIEPFLIVGVVAAIRRLIVISAEAPNFIDEEKFEKLMLELGVLIAAVLIFGLTLGLLRWTKGPPSSPAPSDE